MNDILKKNIISDRNYIQRPIARIIPCYKRESSLERKNIKKSPRNNSTKNGKSKIITKIKNFDFDRPNINNPKIICNNFIKLNYENNIYINNNNISSEKSFNTKKIKEKKENIKLDFQNTEKAKTFNRGLSNNNIKIIYDINKNKSNQIPENNKNRIEINKEEFYKGKQFNEKLIILKNDNKNKTMNINNIKLCSNNYLENNVLIKRNSKRNTDGIIFIKNKEKIKAKAKDKDSLNYMNLNHTINTKNTNLSEPFPINNYNNLILNSNSYNKNHFSLHINNNNLNNNNVKKLKNIDINTEFQTNQKINNNLQEKNLVINNFNNTTGKIKLEPNNFIESKNEKELYYLTENNNNILKTKSKAKIKKEEPEIEIRILDTKESNIIFNNRRIPTNNKIKKDNNLKEKNNKNINFNNNTDLNKKTTAKVKITQNKCETINRNSTYNNESSFLTNNLNNSNIDEKNNESKINLRKYDFPNNNHENGNNNIFNIKAGNNNQNYSNSNNNEKVFKSNSNTQKNIKMIFNEIKNFNILSNNNSTNYNTGNTSNNILNQKSKNNEIFSINERKEMENTKEKEINREKIVIELDDTEEPKDTDDKSNHLKKNMEIKEPLNKEKKEELGEKESCLDKTNSLRIIPISNEDFIEKDDEVLKLLNCKNPGKNSGNNNNDLQIKDEDDSDMTIQNSVFSIFNDQSKYNYCLNGRNIYQNSNANIKNNNLKNANNNNADINNTNITMKDTSIISNYGIKGCKSITQAGKERTGHRKKNQDNYIIEKNLNNILGLNLFAVLDGHGENGHMVSQLASKYIVKKIINSIKNLIDIESIFLHLKASDYQEIINIFLEIDNEIINQKKFDVSLSGTTCVLVIQIGDHLICSNIGDSRAILIYEENNQSKIFELSHDSKPNIPEEIKRINLMGGTIDKILDENGEKTGPYRVYVKGKDYPGLAMSRSFGDKMAKSCGVIPYPDIIEYNLNNSECKYMVICSDGVWEFLSNEEVMLIGDKYYNQNDTNAFCNELLKRATELWENEEKYMDDITIVTVFF